MAGTVFPVAVWMCSGSATQCNRFSIHSPGAVRVLVARRCGQQEADALPQYQQELLVTMSRALVEGQEAQQRAARLNAGSEALGVGTEAS